jgi:hypothetical protein
VGFISDEYPAEEWGGCGANQHIEKVFVTSEMKLEISH